MNINKELLFNVWQIEVIGEEAGSKLRQEDFCVFRVSSNHVGTSKLAWNTE